MSYGKVNEAFWDSERIDGLSDRAALLALFLVTGPHRNAIGCFKLGRGAIMDTPRFDKWGSEGVSEALQELTEKGFIVRDERTGWTFITKGLKHDPIKGRNAAVGALRLALRVPVESNVYKALIEQLEPQLRKEEAHLRKVDGWPLENPYEPPSEAPSEPLRTPAPAPAPAPKNSVPNGTDAGASATEEEDIWAKVFREGKALLIRKTGCNDKTAGACIQTIKAASKDSVDEVRRYCIYVRDHSVGEPMSFAKAWAKNLKAKRHPPGDRPPDAGKRQQVEEAFAEALNVGSASR